jgi:glycosyltransferase involved in cell wall biosynthesis
MNKLITIYGLCYNEEFMLPHFIAHYRKMFPNCRIVLWDNESTDRTHEIAIENHCEIVTYCTNGKLDDEKYLDLKNNGWKTAETPWVCVVDIDELVEISESQLIQQDIQGVTIINFAGYNMVSYEDGELVPCINRAVKSESYNKRYMFKRTVIDEINYSPGSHGANPQPHNKAVFSCHVFRALHYKYIDPNYMVKRHAHFASRLSDNNKKKQYGFHYLFSEKKIRAEFEEARRNAVKIL